MESVPKAVFKVQTNLPVFGDHNLHVLSSLAEAMSLPSGLRYRSEKEGYDPNISDEKTKHIDLDIVICLTCKSQTRSHRYDLPTRTDTVQILRPKGEY